MGYIPKQERSDVSFNSHENSDNPQSVEDDSHEWFRVCKPLLQRPVRQTDRYYSPFIPTLSRYVQNIQTQADP